MQKFLLTNEAIKAIESILAKGDRALVIPTKDGQNVERIRRELVLRAGKEN